MILLCSTAGFVRMVCWTKPAPSRFRTHFKSLHFHSFIHSSDMRVDTRERQNIMQLHEATNKYNMNYSKLNSSVNSHHNTERQPGIK